MSQDITIQYYNNLWKQIHINAIKYTKSKNHQQYCTWIRELSNMMTCHICKNHMNEYFKLNPPELSKDLFSWSWDFHNSVNLRLNKPILDYYTAVLLYSNIY